MKLILIQPPIQDFYDTRERLLPLGLCYLKAAVGLHLPDVEVEVRDYHNGHGRRTVALPDDLGYLKEYYPIPDRSPFSTFHNYYHFGAGFRDLALDVAAAKPDIVGISSLFSAYYKEVLECAKEISAQLDVPIVVGGTHASALPGSLLADPSVDYVIRGEGERPLVELLSALRGDLELADVPNLAYRRDGDIVFNPVAPNYPIETIPPPDFTDFAVDRYRYGRYPLAGVIVSRGCPHQCRFCSVHAVFGRGHRRRGHDDVLDEIRSRYQAGYRAFDFEDDNLTLSRKTILDLCQAIINEFGPGELVLQAMNGVSHFSLDREVLELMREAGFSHLNLSLVSVDEGVCEEYGRPSLPNRFERVVEEGFRLGFKVVAYQILGLPTETLDSMVDTLATLARLPVLVGASPFYLAPGSPLGDESRPDGLWSETDLVRCRLTALGHESRWATQDHIYTLFVATRIVNFLKALELDSDEVVLDEALEVGRCSGERSRLGVELLEKLLSERVAYGATRHELGTLNRFRSGLFFGLWERLGWITTQQGSLIRLSPVRPSYSATTVKSYV